ncbi:type II toxin-antitoxin system Phd/YefM family antitoxin [Streptomyces canus]|uniref:type II toxin-antitoxin system Phd/YefM family antitoxin n=1 Tax=Streptomyces canus TaxID=58343 RepID=UPI00339F7875
MTAREFNQNASNILAAAERGKRITVTKNGRRVAILSPVTDEEVPPYPTDPMGEDGDMPVIRSVARTPRPAYPFRADPMGDLDFPDLGGPALDDDEVEAALRGTGGAGISEGSDE